MPPEYNQTITAERKISDKKYEIDVLDDSGEKKTYTLVLEGGEWKIDQMGFMYYDKWKKSRQLFWIDDNLSSIGLRINTWRILLGIMVRIRLIFYLNIQMQTVKCPMPFGTFMR